MVQQASQRATQQIVGLLPVAVATGLLIGVSRELRSNRKKGMSRMSSNGISRGVTDGRLSPRQRLLVGREIRRETLRQREKPIGQRRPRQQVVAIGFSKARTKDPSIPTTEELEEEEQSGHQSRHLD